MSLITDALRAAQRERARQPTVAPGGAPRQYLAFRSPARAKSPAPSPAVVAGIATVVLAAAVAAFVFSAGRDAEPRPAVAQPELPIVMIDSSAGGIHDERFDDAPRTTAQLTDPAPELPARAAPRSAPAPRRATEYVDEEPAPRTGSWTIAQEQATRTVPPPRIEPRDNVQVTIERQPDATAVRLFREALAAQRRGDHATARDLYGQTLEFDPRNPDVYNNLGTIYRATGSAALAEQAFRRAIEIRPHFSAAWANLGVTLGQQSRTAEAIQALEEAVRLDPGNASAKVNLAVQVNATGRGGEAQRLLLEVLAADQTLPEAHYAMGQVLEGRGDRGGAVRHYSLFLNHSGGRFPAAEAQVRQYLQIIGGTGGR